MQKQGAEPGTLALKNVVAVLLGACVGVAGALGVCFAFAGVMQARWLPMENSGAAVAAAGLVGGFLGGFFALRKGKGTPLVLSLSAAGVMFLAFLALGALFYQEISSPENWIPTLLSCLCGGALAGLCGKKHRKKRRK